MPVQKPSGNQIRQTFIDFFVEKGHTFVPSASLVPGGDATLLFTNSGMVQFKDVFLGTDRRAYTRAVNSQKSMRVAGKHNDLEDVGQDDTHHTFFEMLGNWSFGDYYKDEAIDWAWELLTEVWHLPKEALWASCFEDEFGEIPRDDEAADAWRRQPGFKPEQVLFFGRKDNFWEMAETGPCGPNSELHIDRGESYCEMQEVPGHICQVNGDCARFLELWNLVFIQYNRLDAKSLEPLPAKHVDTGMGFERIVSVIQDVDSNYKTDLLEPLLDRIQQITGQNETERANNLTPYRVIADHSRAAAFLIADGVVPGNTGRNYVCRMIIRRAARFAGKIGLNEPFMAEIAALVVDNYEEAYPELTRNRTSIFETITQEERRFQRTLESGVNHLENLLTNMRAQGKTEIPGDQAFDLYATYGLPLEITRDIVREQGLDVDEGGFIAAMDQHRVDSGAGQAIGEMGGADAEFYRNLITDLQTKAALPGEGVHYEPYGSLDFEGTVLALVQEATSVQSAAPGDRVEVLLPESHFYLEAGGQVSDTGTLLSVQAPRWEIRVDDVRQPAAGAMVHVGEVIRGEPRVGDQVLATVEKRRRLDIMRNHTATHLLHAELRAVLGEHARQAGSLVAPDRLRFDFSHNEAVSDDQLARIEAGVNRNILANYPLKIALKPLQEAIAQGAMALFGEKYEETVRTITIGDPEPFSYELCGGTHLDQTADIGTFLITSEGSVGAGLRRIEAITGRAAYELVQKRFQTIQRTAHLLNVTTDEIPAKTESILKDLSATRKQVSQLEVKLAGYALIKQLDSAPLVHGVPVLTSILPAADADTLRQMADRFRERCPSGVAVLASVRNDRPVLIATVTDDLVKRGLHAGELVKSVARLVGGGGGGRPTMAQAGGTDPNKLDEALTTVIPWVERKLQPGE
jgi:alanyl-tRNA synthetase